MVTTNSEPDGAAYAIPFTQFLMPHGEKREVFTAVTGETAVMAQKLVDAGACFEAEVLRTGEVSFEISVEDDDGEHQSLAMEISQNGPGVVGALDRLVRDAHGKLEKIDA